MAVGGGRWLGFEMCEGSSLARAQRLRLTIRVFWYEKSGRRAIGSYTIGARGQRRPAGYLSPQLLEHVAIA